MGELKIERLSPHLYRLGRAPARRNAADRRTARGYVLVDGDHAIAIDPGALPGQTGALYIGNLEDIGVKQLDRIYLTHHHDDHCRYLTNTPQGCEIHAPAGEAGFFDAETDSGGRDKKTLVGIGCPGSYDPPRAPVEDVLFDVVPNDDHYWRKHRIRCISTPGHSAAAVSVLIDIDGMSTLFSGDAVYHGGRLYEPFHIETDHWTGTGALAAWEGIRRLEGIRIDLICPTHGPVIRRRIHSTLTRLDRRLMRFYRSKGQISPREHDAYISSDDSGRISDHLYRFGTNGYLVTSDNGEGFVIDPTIPDLKALETLVQDVGVTITGYTSTHYHADHVDGVPELQKTYDARFIVHESVAFPVWPASRYSTIRVPWLPATPIRPDVVLEDGGYSWNEYTMSIFHAPGQTWWHASIAATIDGSRILFSGDSFQPASRWNGTGGFCAYNRSRLLEGYIPTCRKITRIAPDIVAAGHGTIFKYRRAKFRKIIRWARKSERRIRALCPTKRTDIDYYRWPVS